MKFKIYKRNDKRLEFNTDRFSVNLIFKTLGNIALHFKPRLDRGYIVYQEHDARILGGREDQFAHRSEQLHLLPERLRTFHNLLHK